MFAYSSGEIDINVIIMQREEKKTLWLKSYFLTCFVDVVKDDFFLKQKNFHLASLHTSRWSKKKRFRPVLETKLKRISVKTADIMKQRTKWRLILVNSTGSRFAAAETWFISRRRRCRRKFCVRRLKDSYKHLYSEVNGKFITFYEINCSARKSWAFLGKVSHEMSRFRVERIPYKRE